MTDINKLLLQRASDAAQLRFPSGMLRDRPDLIPSILSRWTFQLIRLRLAYRLQSQTWLAYPVNEAAMRQQFKTVKPLPMR
jgi:hypothetical protein